MNDDRRSGVATVDVGIPVWGQSRHLSTAIASVSRQTLTSWRLHISVDGPPQSPVEGLVAAAADRRISCSATGDRIGAGKNKTRLVRSGDAPYIALLDHDDLWDAHFLLRRVQFLEAHPDCGFVCSPLNVVDVDGNLVERRSPLLLDGVYASEAIVPVLLRATGIPGGSVVIRRSALQQVGDEFCDFLPRTYDYAMWIRLALRFPVGYLGVRDVYWRRHAANSSLANLRDYEREYEQLVTYLHDMVARERPDLLPAEAFWDHKLSDLLRMTSLDAVSSGDRRTAFRYLWLAMCHDRHGALSGRMLSVGLTVGLGRPGTALAASLARINDLRRAVVPALAGAAGRRPRRDVRT